MISDILLGIVDSTLDVCEELEHMIDVDDLEEAYVDTVIKDMETYLSVLAMKDGVIARREIEFVNECFNDQLSLLDIKRSARECITDDYEIPVSIEKAAILDIENLQRDENTHYAQKLVNTYYYLGLEFIACDDEIAPTEISYLTMLISEYQNYLREEGIENNSLDVLGELASQYPDYVKRDKYETVVQTDKMAEDKKKRQQEYVSAYCTGEQFSSLKVKLQAKSYDAIRHPIMNLMNELQIRDFREAQGLYNEETYDNYFILGECGTLTLEFADMITDIIAIRGDNAKKSILPYSASIGSKGTELIENFWRKNQDGVLLIRHAANLSQGEVYFIEEHRRDQHAPILLFSEETIDMLDFLEKNRGLHQYRTKCIFLDGYSEELVCDIIEMLCTNQDYKIGETAKKLLSESVQKEKESIELYHLFFLVDQIIKEQGKRILKRNVMTREEASTIISQDVVNVLKNVEE